VLDTFMGSGSTILAAEETGRVGIGIDLDPLYANVAIRRWQACTRCDALHAETGEFFDDRAWPRKNRRSAMAGKDNDGRVGYKRPRQTPGSSRVKAATPKVVPGTRRRHQGQHAGCQRHRILVPASLATSPKTTNPNQPPPTILRFSTSSSGAKSGAALRKATRMVSLSLNHKTRKRVMKNELKSKLRNDFLASPTRPSASWMEQSSTMTGIWNISRPN
jgi:DNA methylase